MEEINLSEKYYKIDELAKKLNVSQSTIFKAMRENRIRSTNTSEGSLRFAEEDVVSYVALCNKENKSGITFDEKFIDDVQKLRRIKSKLDHYLVYETPHKYLNAKQVYDEVILSFKELKVLFPTVDKFRAFIKEQYNAGLLLQVIRNCRVDNSNPNSFKYEFFKPRRYSNAYKSTH